MTRLMTSARRALWLVVLGAAGGTVYTLWRERQAPTGPINPPEWPPIRADAAAVTTTDTAGQPSPAREPATEPANAAAFVNALVDTPDARPATPDGRWAPPDDDGSCPVGFPIKANDNSGIYHVPTGRFYGRTKAERCYATADGAEADGYRAAKS